MSQFYRHYFRCVTKGCAAGLQVRHLPFRQSELICTDCGEPMRAEHSDDAAQMVDVQLELSQAPPAFKVSVEHTPEGRMTTVAFPALKFQSVPEQLNHKVSRDQAVDHLRNAYMRWPAWRYAMLGRLADMYVAAEAGSDDDVVNAQDAVWDLVVEAMGHSAQS